MAVGGVRGELVSASDYLIHKSTALEREIQVLAVLRGLSGDQRIVRESQVVARGASGSRSKAPTRKRVEDIVSVRISA